MEPVTHILTGACVARSGLNRKAAYATLAMAVGAEFPDIDTLWSLDGPIASFQHHRGITHTLVGLPFEAALIVAGVYLMHRVRARRAPSRKSPSTVADTPDTPAPRKPLTAAPVRWGLLYGFTLLALLTHLLLDYTNNYGIRPFFPFNPRWYAASITFIFDPWMFLLLLFALILPPLFRLVSSEVGVRRQPFAARGWSAAALLLVCALWAWRAVEHTEAATIAGRQSYSLANDSGGAEANGDAPSAELPPTILPAQRVLINPDPLNPMRWYSVTDFGPLYQLGTVDLRAGTSVPEQGVEMKRNLTPELRAAEASQLGRAYLDWSPMPYIDLTHRDERAFSGGPDDRIRTVVTFRDPRFLGESPWLHRARSRAPLTGVITLDANNQVIAQTIDGKPQR